MKTKNQSVCDIFFVGGGGCFAVDPGLFIYLLIYYLWAEVGSCVCVCGF